MNEKPVVLIIDDNSLNRRIMMNFIKRMDVDVVESDNDASAIRVLLDNQVDLILMDYFKPSVNEFETVKNIRNLNVDYANVPIIAVTNNLNDSLREVAMKNQINNIINKPLQKSEIEAVFAKYFKMEKSDIFNVKDFENFYKDAGLRKDILQTFMEETESDLLKISTSFHTKECDTIYKTAHYLKGTFNYLKAKTSLETSIEILRLCKEGIVKDVVKLEKELVENYKELISSVQKYMNKNDIG